MAFVLQLVTILVIATVTTAQLSKSKISKKYDPDDIQTQPSLLTILQSPDSTDTPPSLPINLELPREEAPDVPFYSPEPDTYTMVKAPSVTYFGNPAVDYNSPYPVPSQDLQLPSMEPWNPNHDPKFYYEFPPVVTKQELPTNIHPKKYNKDVYQKQKPLSSRPKQEISLVPISEQEYINKQRNINKVLLNLAKVQNQKLVESEKPQQAVQV